MQNHLDIGASLENVHTVKETVKEKEKGVGGRFGS